MNKPTNHFECTHNTNIYLSVPEKLKEMLNSSSPSCLMLGEASPIEYNVGIFLNQHAWQAD